MTGESFRGGVTGDYYTGMVTKSQLLARVEQKRRKTTERGSEYIGRKTRMRKRDKLGIYIKERKNVFK